MSVAPLVSQVLMCVASAAVGSLHQSVTASRRVVVVRITVSRLAAAAFDAADIVRSRLGNVWVRVRDC